MKCNNCGYDMPDDAAFCDQCGSRVTNSSNTEALKKSKNKSFIIAFALMIIAAVGIGLTVRYISNSSSVQEPSSQTDTGSTEGEPAPSRSGDSAGTDTNTDIGTDTATDSSDFETNTYFDTPFIIDANASADYTKILDPSRYEFYSSDIPEFSFWYPTDFFDHVIYDTDTATVSYGTNAEQIVFSADDGAQLIFHAVRRTDSMTLKEMSNYVYTTEMGMLTSGETILNAMKDDYGKVIVTGYTDNSFGYTVYSLNKIRSDYVLQMHLVFPAYTDEEDRMQKWYLTECFYRMCGFSDADPWRSYTEYVRENS